MSSPHEGLSGLGRDEGRNEDFLDTNMLVRTKSKADKIYNDLPVKGLRQRRGIQMLRVDRGLYFVKERVGFFKAANAYDIMDENGEGIGVVQEEIPNVFVKILKFTDYKPYLPWTIWFSDAQEKRLFHIKRGFTIFFSKITVHDADGRILGYFQQKFSLLKHKFEVYNSSNELVAHLIGDWKGWDFKLVDHNEKEIISVTKQWAGLGKELFTSADNYVIAFNSEYKMNADQKKLYLSAAITIDMVLKESTR